jgi:phosphatidylglycerophosphatase GEP4
MSHPASPDELAQAPPSAPPPEQRTRWWQKVGQSVNMAGVNLFLHVRGGHEELAIPHVSVPDIRWVDWQAVRRAGFEGAAFDKDNTLTLPYIEKVHPELQKSLEDCKKAFDGRVCLFSNSAGLEQFDPEGRVAAKLEAELGIPVLRHSEKKPAGGPEDLEKHFGCKAEKLVMVGDRYMTDVVFGNRLGMMTIRPAPLTWEGDPSTVRMSRRIEERYVRQWTKRGVQAPKHRLVPDAATLATFARKPHDDLQQKEEAKK